MKQSKFKFVEGCLYHYIENLALLEVKRDELNTVASVHAQQYTEHIPNGGEPNDPVFERAAQIEKLEKEIRSLERKTKPIARMLGDLKRTEILGETKYIEIQRILELKYFSVKKVNNVHLLLHMSLRTFIRRRRQLIEIAMRYFEVM